MLDQGVCQTDMCFVPLKSINDAGATRMPRKSFVFQNLPNSGRSRLPAAVFVDAPGLSWGISNFGFASVGHQSRKGFAVAQSRDDMHAMRCMAKHKAQEGDMILSLFGYHSKMRRMSIAGKYFIISFLMPRDGSPSPRHFSRCTVLCPSSTRCNRCTRRRNDSDNNIPIHVLQCGM